MPDTLDEIIKKALKSWMIKNECQLNTEEYLSLHRTVKDLIGLSKSIPHKR